MPNSPVEQPTQNNGGPRIVVNPKVFSDKRDALCVAMNEAFRVIMEMNEFEPVSEPTEKQRKFFADTAYADDELMLRRTILARICTFDTSVTDPTTEQLQESAEFLETVMEIGAPQNEWEQQAVQRIHDVLVKASGTGAAPTENAEEPEAPVDTEGTTQGAIGGGIAEDDEDKFDETQELFEGNEPTEQQRKEFEDFMTEATGRDVYGREVGQGYNADGSHKSEGVDYSDPEHREPERKTTPVAPVTGSTGTVADVPQLVNQDPTQTFDPLQAQKDAMGLIKGIGTKSGMFTEQAGYRLMAGAKIGNSREMGADESRALMQRAMNGATISASQAESLTNFYKSHGYSDDQIQSMRATWNIPKENQLGSIQAHKQGLIQNESPASSSAEAAAQVPQYSYDLLRRKRRRQLPW